MAGSRTPGPTGTVEETIYIDKGTMCLAETPAPGPTGIRPTHPEDLGPDPAELRELALDLLQLALDLAGIIEPTPFADGSNALISLGRGRWLDALLSGASIIPYIGDLAKAGKLPRYARSVEKALELARKSQRTAAALTPGIAKLKKALDLLPNGVNQYIDRMKSLSNEFLIGRSAMRVAGELPDISKHFKFKTYARDGKTYREASGRLGVPGKVKTHRSRSAQQVVAGGTGDDAGHLIGDRFGAPGTAENLAPQNWIANRRGGTYSALEDQWARKLEQGHGVEVKIVDVTRAGESRPFMREVHYSEIAPDGSRTSHSLSFANPHTPKSRDAQEIAPTVTTPQHDNLINVDFRNKKRL